MRSSGGGPVPSRHMVCTPGRRVCTPRPRGYRPGPPVGSHMADTHVSILIFIEIKKCEMNDEMKRVYI